MALLDHRWDHFAQSSAATPPERLRLPTELAPLLESIGRRPLLPPPAQSFNPSDIPAELLAARPPAPLVQRSHIKAQRCGVQRGEGVVLRARYGPPPTTAAEFETRPIAVDGFVITPGATHSPLAKASPALAGETLWVWRVLRIFPAGEPLPANTMGRQRVDVDVFEAQVYAPVRPGLGSPMEPCWDKMSRAVFLKTRAERLAKRQRNVAQRSAPSSLGSVGSPEGAHDSVYEPLCAFLRAGNVYGGGFFLTTTSRVPAFVRSYAERRAREEKEQDDDDAPLA